MKKIKQYIKSKVMSLLYIEDPDFPIEINDRTERLSWRHTIKRNREYNKGKQHECI